MKVQREVTVWTTALPGGYPEPHLFEGVTEFLVREVGSAAWLHVEVGNDEVYGFPLGSVVRWIDDLGPVAGDVPRGTETA